MKSLTIFVISACILTAIHGVSIAKPDSQEVKSDNGNEDLKRLLESSNGVVSQAVVGIRDVRGQILFGVDRVAPSDSKNAAEEIMDKINKPNNLEAR